MPCRVTLAVAVVCVGGVCSGVQVDLVSGLTMPRELGVKLCGREFIRAVIFTCGGSRWRRSTEGGSVPFQRSSLSDVTPEDNQHSRQPGRSLADASSPRPGDPLALHVQQRSLGDPAPLTSTVLLGERDGSQGKGRRNFSLGVTAKCCSHGCTKIDIERLCRGRGDGQ